MTFRNRKRLPTSSPVLDDSHSPVHEISRAGLKKQRTMHDTAALIELLGRMDKRLEGIERDMGELKAGKDAYLTEMKVIRKDIVSMKETQIKMERYMRRCNLVFRGIPEADHGENCESVIRAVMRDHLELQGWDVIEVDRAFRLGKPRQQRSPRPILICFTVVTDCEMVRAKAYNLKGKRISISEDLPRELQERRNRLVPILKEKHKTNGRCSIRSKGNDFVLYVDNTPYITGTDIEGTSEEACQLRERYNVNSNSRNYYANEDPKRTTNAHPQSPTDIRKAQMELLAELSGLLSPDRQHTMVEDVGDDAVTHM